MAHPSSGFEQGASTVWRIGVPMVSLAGAAMGIPSALLVGGGLMVSGPMLARYIATGGRQGALAKILMTAAQSGNAVSAQTLKPFEKELAGLSAQ